MKTLHAYCWSNGLIQFGETVPTGTLPLLSGRPSAVRNKIIATARHSRVSRRMFVPGVPEASAMGYDPVDAVIAYVGWINPQHRAATYKPAHGGYPGLVRVF